MDRKIEFPKHRMKGEFSELRVKVIKRLRAQFLWSDLKGETQKQNLPRHRKQGGTTIMWLETTITSGLAAVALGQTMTRRDLHSSGRSTPNILSSGIRYTSSLMAHLYCIGVSTPRAINCQRNSDWDNGPHCFSRWGDYLRWHHSND